MRFLRESETTTIFLDSWILVEYIFKLWGGGGEEEGKKGKSRG
jgi:hypothetical protein